MLPAGSLSALHKALFFPMYLKNQVSKENGTLPPTATNAYLLENKTSFPIAPV